MRQLIIDRFEGMYAICEEWAEEKAGEKGKKPARNAKDIKFFGIEKGELPQHAKEGSVLCIDGEGSLTLDEAATKARRDRINALQGKLWKK